jgi:molybdopterin-guanine dinucleotide biosynthesis protein A
MGRDKASVRLGRRTLLGHARAAARALGLPIRVIRRDLVPRCGPIGGVFTALVTTRAAAVIFLSCDMPLVTPALLGRLISTAQMELEAPDARAVFTTSSEGAGFPFLIRRALRPQVERQIERGRFSLQKLARALRARRVRPTHAQSAQLANLNTPAELAAVRLRLAAGRRQPQSLSQKAR